MRDKFKVAIIIESINYMQSFQILTRTVHKTDQAKQIEHAFNLNIVIYNGNAS